MWVASAGEASKIYTTELSDITQGITQNSRIGTEIVGKNFEVNLNVYNKTNNELFLRFTLIERAGRGATGDITDASGLYQDPAGSVNSYAGAVSVAQSAPIMWKYDTKGSVKVLKDKVISMPKNNGGNEGSTRSIKWNVPYDKKIRFVSDTVQGGSNQSRRVSLITTAWSPVSTTQATYTYQVDGWGKFNFKDM